MIFLCAGSVSAATLTETSKSDFDSFGDSSSVSARRYVSNGGELELAPVVATETTLSTTNTLISLAYDPVNDRLYAGGMSGVSGEVPSYRRTPAGTWQRIQYTDTVTTSRKLVWLRFYNSEIWGGTARDNANSNSYNLVKWSAAGDTWFHFRNMNAVDAEFDGAGRASGIFNGNLYFGDVINGFLGYTDGTIVDARDMTNPKPSGTPDANDINGMIVGLVPYPVAGPLRLFFSAEDPSGGAADDGHLIRSQDFGGFAAEVSDVGADDQGIIAMARFQVAGLGDTLFILKEGGATGPDVHRSIDGSNLTNDIDFSALFGVGANFFDNVADPTEAARAMSLHGRDLWVGGGAASIYRYVGDYDTWISLAATTLSSGIRQFETFRGADGETWIAIAGYNGANGRVDRFRFADSGLYTADTKTLSTTGWMIADSAQISARANSGTVAVSFFFGRDTAELAARTFGETFTITTSGDFTFNFTKPNPSGRVPGNAWRMMTYQVRLATENTTTTPYFEGVTLHYHEDVTAPSTASLLSLAANHDTKNQRPRFEWTNTFDTVNGTLESGMDTVVLELDTGLAGAFTNPQKFILPPDSTIFIPPFNLGPDTAYIWRVRAYDTSSNVSTSETRLIRIDVTIPPVAASPVPPDNTDTTDSTPLLDWADVLDTFVGTRDYRVELQKGTTASFSSPITATVTTSQHQIVTALDYNTNDTWFWRIITTDSATNFSVSDTFEFRVTYSANIRFTDSVFTSINQYVVGETAYVEVRDLDESRSATIKDTLTVTLSSIIGVDTETFTLTETDTATGLFRGSILLSDTRGPSAGDGILLIGVGDTIRFSYVDPNDADDTPETTAATLRRSTNGVIDFDSTAYPLDTRPRPTLVDPDRNRNPRLRETVTVTMLSPNRADTEPFLLTETSETSGIFVGDSITLSDTVGAIVSDSRLFVAVGDEIRIEYADAFETDTGLDTASVLRIFRASSVTAVDIGGIATDSADPRDTLAARVSDPDANRNVVGRDTVSLVFTNLQTGDTATLVLRETTDTSGLFGPDTGVPASSLNVVLGKTVRFDYADGTDTSADTVVILYRPTVATIDFTIDSALRDSSLFVTVTDSDQNRDGLLAETVSVTIRSLRGLDTESLTLTETAVSGAAFQNAVALRMTDTGTASIENGRLTVRPSYDTIVVEYADGGGTRSDTIVFLFSRSSAALSMMNKFGNGSLQFTTGDTLSARVVDPDQNSTVAREGSAEQVAVTIQNLRVGDSETLTLFETANLSAQLDSVAGIATSNNPADSLPGSNVVFAIAGDTLVLKYTDPSDGTDTEQVIVAAASTPTPSTTLFTDSTGISLDTFTIGDSFVYITVSDTDENIFPLTADQVSVKIWCAATNDTETITLTEIGNDSNIFRNAGLRISDTMGAALEDGILLAGRGDTIKVFYTDASDPTDSSNDIAAIFGRATSSRIDFDTTLYFSPDTPTITLNDPDRNVDPLLVETLAVSVRSDGTTDTETIVLTETSALSGVFTGVIPISTLSGLLPDDGILLVLASDVIRVNYVDGSDTSEDTATAALAPSPVTITIVDSALVSRDTVVRAETSSIRVIDAAGNQNSLAVETIAVTVRNDRTLETMTLVLTEQSVASDQFVSTSGFHLPDSLSVLPGDTIRATYKTSEDTAIVVPKASVGVLRLKAVGGNATDTFRIVTDSVFIEVTDTDRNRAGLTVEQVVITIEISATGETETHTLTEASADSSVFRSAGLRLVDTTSVVANNGILVGGVDDVIEARYGAESSDTATITTFLRASTSRFINSSGADVTLYVTGDSARIEVTDYNGNRDPLLLETVTATIRNGRTGETEIVSLRETTAFGGVFRFDTGLLISTSAADSVSNTGVIFAAPADSLIIDYADAFDAADSSTDTVTIRPAPTSSALLFTDASGNSTASYRMDSFVYVTLLDTDQNANGSAVETVTVSVYDPNTLDTETISLTELSANSSTFRNIAGLRISDTTGIGINNGTLHTGVVFEIRASYVDAFTPTDSASDTANLTPAPIAATITLDRPSYTPDTRVFVTLSDGDRNRNPLVKDSVTVSLVSTIRTDTETITLNESTETSGVFTSAAGTRVSDTTGFAVEDGTLLVAFGDTFLIRYADAFDANDLEDTTGNMLNYNTVATAAYDSVSYRVTDSVTITVVDRDKNRNPRIFDTISVTVQNVRLGDSETLTLTETDSASFTFRSNALVLSDTGSSAAGNGVVRVDAGDTIPLRFFDSTFSDTVETTALIRPRPTQATASWADTVTENGTLIISVTDPDQNVSPYTREAIVLREVLVRSSGGSVIDNEFNTIVLVETTETSGIFNSPPITFSSIFTPTSNDTKLLIGFNHQIEVDYRDSVNLDIASDTAQVTWFTGFSSSDLDRTIYAIGHTLYATVIDTDRNRTPLGKDTLSVTVYNTVTGESESRILYETLDRSGTFTDTEGVLLTADPNDSLSVNRRLYVRTGDSVSVQYTDAFFATDSSADTSGVATAPDTTFSTIAFTTAAGIAVTAYRMDSFVYITIRDTDQNFDGTLAETALVDVYDTNTGDSERISLTEVTADTGVFRNVTGLRISDTTGATINDGILFTGAVSYIQARYQDPLRSVDSSSTTATLTVVPSAAQLTLDRSSYSPESGVFVTLRDLDRNRNPMTADSVTVTLVDVLRADTETIVLTETSATSGVFTNATAARMSDTQGTSANDGILLVALGDNFRVSYADAFDASDTEETTPAIIAIATLGISRFDRVSYTLNDSVVLTVTDRDRNADPRVADTFAVSVRNFRTGDSETILLTETAAASLGFSANTLILIDTGTPTAGDGKLLVGTGDSILMRYFDPIRGDTHETTANIGITPTTGQIVIPDTLTVYDNLQITVIDNDRNINQNQKDTLILQRVEVVDPESTVIENEFNTIQMIETTESSGVFNLVNVLRLFDTAFPVVAGDTRLTVGFNFVIRIQYQDPVQLDFASDTILIVDSPVAASLTLNQSLYNVGDTVFATILDRDENRFPTRRDTLTVVISNATTGEIETRALRESTGISFTFVDDTGLFLSSFVSDSGSNSGRLYVRGGDSIQVSYTDPNFASDSVLTTTFIETSPSSIAINLTSYRAADPLIVTITDFDENRTSSADTVAVFVRSFGTNDGETVTLTETAITSGIFRNSGLRLSDTLGIVFNDGILFIGKDDTFSVRYVDPNDAADFSETSAIFIRTSSRSISAFNQDAYVPADSVFVTVTDVDRNFDPLLKETMAVAVFNTPRNDTETILLTETTETSGIFRNLVGLAFEVVGTGVANDGKIQALLNDSFSISYLDILDATDTSLDTATLTIAAIASIRTLTVYFADTVEIRVTPLDANGDTIPSIEGLLPVQIIASAGGTGVFTNDSAQIVGGYARFGYSKREDALLFVTFRISNDSFPTIISLSAAGTAMTTISDELFAGSVGAMLIPSGLFPANAKFIVENASQIAESAALSAKVDIARRDLRSIPNLKIISDASGDSVRTEHQFFIRVSGVNQTSLPGEVTVMISYPDANNDGIVDGTSINELSLKVYRLDEDRARFEVEANSTVDAARNWITVKVNHFTLFSVGGGATVTGLSSLNVYPNPFQPNSGLGHVNVTFENVPAGSKIRIFTADGREVDQLLTGAGTTSVRWDGKNRTGQNVASGVYVYVVEFGGERKVGKVVVIR